MKYRIVQRDFANPKLVRKKECVKSKCAREKRDTDPFAAQSHCKCGAGLRKLRQLEKAPPAFARFYRVMWKDTSFGCFAFGFGDELVPGGKSPRHHGKSNE